MLEKLGTFGQLAKAATLSVALLFAGGALGTTVEYVGIEWLADLSSTSGLSRDQVEAGFGVGGAFEGFRYASYTEWDTLFGTRYPNALTGASGSDARDDVLSFVNDFDIFEEGLSVSNSFGDYLTWGIVFGNPDDTYPGGLTPPDETSLRFDYFACLEVGNCVSDGGPLGGFYQQNDVGTPGKFSLLVRDSEVSVVPVPAAAWLFLSGLAAIKIVGRRKIQTA